MTKVYRCTVLRRLVALLLPLGLAMAGAAALAAGLPLPVANALKDAGIPMHNVAVLVRGTEQDQPLISHNVRSPMNPASVMKLLTTYAALEMLGPAHTWTTEALADSQPVDGRLEGSLYLRGSGDPRLGLEQFWLLLRQLRTRGIRDIAGDLVLDRSAFALPPHNPAEFDNEPLRPYNAGPDALLVNLKSLSFTLHPDLDGARVELWHETPGTDRLTHSQLKLSNGSCGDWREKLEIALESDTVVLRGTFPASCGNKTLNLSPWPDNLQIERLFRALWQEQGGTLLGKVRDGTAPADARLLATHISPTLGEVVREINKYSNNVMARQLFLTLDAARPATPEGARRTIHTWLADKGLAMPELVLDNGSGLSRTERISAESLAQLLLAAWQSPVMPELLASLPLAGIDGTLKKRLADSPATGRAHLKTGYLENVRALAGYVLDNGGKRWIVVFMINDARSRQGKAAMDALLQWVAERGVARKPASVANAQAVLR